MVYSLIHQNELADPIESFACFNDFFYRKLREGARPIASPDDPVCYVGFPTAHPTKVTRRLQNTKKRRSVLLLLTHASWYLTTYLKLHGCGLRGKTFPLKICLMMNNW